jgi:transposase
VVVMEACGSAHYWARRIRTLGHRVLLLPPHHVRPYVRGNKTDRNDAKGLLEASRNEGIHPVPVKTVEQQVLTALHRLRAGWMRERTARLNALRGVLREFGVFIPVGSLEVVPAVLALIEDADSELPDALRSIFHEACQEIREIEARMKQVERQLEGMAAPMPAVELLLTIPGIGLLTATALVAFLGDIRRFSSGRHLASYLGLTPREFSSGLKRNLGRISKRGDGYLRTMLIHGARSVLVTHAGVSRTGCASGPMTFRRNTFRTKSRWPSRTSSPVSSGPSGPPAGRSSECPRPPEPRDVVAHHPPQELLDAMSVTAKQVGPAPGPSRTIVAFEAAVIDWRGARIPSWPGALGSSSIEAEDTYAVRPVSQKRSLRPLPS